MSGSQYPSDVQFAGLIQAATAAADAQERNASILGKRRRSDDDSLIDVQLREQSNEGAQNTGQLPPLSPILQNSASVLFREPSEKSKKYSRPPLGKVYTDLQLAPETFLRLQNAAKAHMLDEAHPERRDVVGHKKHSSNNDVAKLRLWGVVEDFLNHDDNGERWFGRNAGTGIPDAPTRTIFWPDDKHKITKLCMPLFRKMVTNERQRIYASETRSKDSTSKTNHKKSTNGALANSLSNVQQSQLEDNDLSIAQSLVDSDVTQDATLPIHQQQRPPQAVSHLTIHVNIVTNDDGVMHRQAPQFSIPSESVTTLATLFIEVRKNYQSNQSILTAMEMEDCSPVVKVWLPDGLIHVKDDGQWMITLLSASMVEWMDSEVRVLIELNPTSENTAV